MRTISVAKSPSHHAQACQLVPSGGEPIRRAREVGELLRGQKRGIAVALSKAKEELRKLERRAASGRIQRDAPHRPLLLNYFKARKRFSSGVVEGLNNKAKVTMRRSYGFRTFRVLELALYHSLGRLPEPQLTHEFF
jgi:Transposase